MSMRQRREQRVVDVSSELLEPGEQVVAVTMCLVGEHPMREALKASLRWGLLRRYTPQRLHVVVTDRRLLVLAENPLTARPVTDGHLSLSLDAVRVELLSKALRVVHPALAEPFVLFFPKLTRDQQHHVAGALASVTRGPLPHTVSR